MIKFFKIIEKVVWAITALSIFAVVTMLFIGYFGSFNTVQLYWPFLFGATAIVLIYKIVVIFFVSLYQTRIKKLKRRLTSLKNELKKEDVDSQEGYDQSLNLETIIEAVKQNNCTDIDAIIAIFQERILEVVQKLVDQQVEEKIREKMLEYEEPKRENNILFANITDILKTIKDMETINVKVNQYQEIIRQRRLTKTVEYTRLVFSLADTPVEDVEKVCEVVKLFIETGAVVASDDLNIPFNKKLRNSELKQFVTNIIRYNNRSNLDRDSFLLIVFCEWFKCKKENIGKNYKNLPSDSLVKDCEVEAEIKRLSETIDKEKCEEELLSHKEGEVI